MHRRQFLAASTAASVASAAALPAASLAAPSANDRLTVCVMGVRGRGGNLLSTFAALPDVEVKYVCDIDENVLKARIENVHAITGRRPLAIGDYRRALDDPSVDAIINGGPDHWHALPAIHACQAGKDVYTEKPDAHNILEGRTMAAAAKKHKRIIQLGTQGRSGIFQRSAIKYIATGALGKVRFAKAWESSRQGVVKKVPDSAPPKGVDYDTWLGPAPKRPFNRYRFHTHWRWFFDYGTGDLGNDGVHRLDIARWALETALAASGEKTLGPPTSVSALGGKYYFDDAQEWPDTLIVSYDYAGRCVMTYEMRLWTAYHMHGVPEGAAVYGDEGSVVIGNRGWRAFDRKGKQISVEDGADNTVGHARNFLDCIRSRQKPNADLETVGQPSSLLCHLGNAAWRTGRTLHFDAAKSQFKNDPAANALLTRPAYRRPWLLPKLADV